METEELKAKRTIGINDIPGTKRAESLFAGALRSLAERLAPGQAMELETNHLKTATLSSRVNKMKAARILTPDVRVIKRGTAVYLAKDTVI